jgi:dinuclear metal center YbgI/SA1388 family protein
MISPRVSDVLGIINKIAPFRYAEEWDNVGLQVGDPAAPAERIMVALDPGRDALDAAVADSCHLLLTHHPLIFTPLKKIAATDPTGNLVALAIRHGLTVASLHTNFDIAAGGVNDLLAQRLGIASCQPLKTTGAEELVKLSVFVPQGHEEQVLEALFRFSGVIGNYRDCSFRTGGTGTFTPQAGARPFIGEVGKREEVGETRVEVLVRGTDTAAAVKALLKAHPYEEPAFDLYPLLNKGEERGLGRIGELAAATTLGEFAAFVKERLGLQGVRYVGDAGRRVRKVALCGGSGVSLLRTAQYQGADVLVTGDVKYHEAREAEVLGLALVDAGHFATERVMVQGLAARLEKELAEGGFTATVTAFNGEREPFTYR